MSNSYTLVPGDELFVQAQLASGRYDDASEVIHDALQLLERRARARAELDAALAVALADVAAGRVVPAEEAFAQVRAKIAALPNR